MGFFYILKNTYLIFITIIVCCLFNWTRILHIAVLGQELATPEIVSCIILKRKKNFISKIEIHFETWRAIIIFLSFSDISKMKGVDKWGGGLVEPTWPRGFSNMCLGLYSNHIYVCLHECVCVYVHSIL